MVPIKIYCDCGQKYAFDVEPVNGRMPSAVTCPVCGADGTPAANALIAQQIPPQPMPQIRLVSTPNGAPAPAAIQAMPSVPVAATVPMPPPMPVAASAQPGPVRIAPTAIQPTSAPAPVRLAPPAIQPVASAPAPVRLAPAAIQPASSPTVFVSPSVQTAPAPAARGPRVDPRLGLVDRTQAEHEARAKVMWGDTQEQVVSYLMVQGWTHPEASDLVKGIFKERTSAVRAAGIRKMLSGFGLMWIPVIALIICHSIGFYPVKLLGMAVLAGLYGVWLLINGFLMFVAPKSEKGDVADK